MDRTELAFSKQTLFAVKDWDGFQEVLRYMAKMSRLFSSPGLLAEQAAEGNKN